MFTFLKHKFTGRFGTSAALTFALVLLPLACAIANSKPNLLLVVADDLGYEALGSYGGTDFSTPHLDEFARESVRLNRVYTSAVCTPSRMSLYTGQYVVNHGYTSVLPVHLGSEKFVDFSSVATLPKTFQNAGYLTSTTGKWQLAALEHHPDHLRKSGFDSWCVWQIWKDGSKTTRYENPCFNQDGVVRTDIADHFGPDVLYDYVIQQMKTAVAAEEPFYIHHNMLLPHWPIVPTPAEKKRGEKGSLSGMIAYTDQLFGKLLREIDALGIRDNTWVIFLGDNGTDSKKPRNTRQGIVTGGKHHLVEGGIHIPALLRGPGLPEAGIELNDLIDMTDFFPTLCALAGIELPEEAVIDGVSFSSRLLGKEKKAARNFVTAAYRNDDCVFDGKWRLHRKGNALWDCRNLPTEVLIEKETEETARARSRLARIRESIQRP